MPINNFTGKHMAAFSLNFQDRSVLPQETIGKILNADYNISLMAKVFYAPQTRHCVGLCSNQYHQPSYGLVNYFSVHGNESLEANISCCKAPIMKEHIRSITPKIRKKSPNVIGDFFFVCMCVVCVSIFIWLFFYHPNTVVWHQVLNSHQSFCAVQWFDRQKHSYIIKYSSTQQCFGH